MAPIYIATVHFLRCINKKRARKSYHVGCGTFTLAGYDILQCVFLHVLDIATILLLLDPVNLIVNLDRVARSCYLIMLYDRTQLIGTRSDQIHCGIEAALRLESQLRTYSWYDRGLPQGDELQSFVPLYEMSNLRRYS